jgi:hypothetical protein
LCQSRFRAAEVIEMAVTRATGGRGSGKRPQCRICKRAIYVPKGWSAGAATRRHYWSKHPEVMRKGRKAAT